MSKKSPRVRQFPYQFDPSGQRLSVRLSAKVYPHQAVLGAAYTLIDKVYVYIDGDPKKELTVFLRPKQKLDAAQAKSLVGDFQNELLSQVLRLQVARQTKKTREQIVTAALGSAMPRGVDKVDDQEIDRILKESEQTDYAGDPLGIAVPWEERYGKKKAKLEVQPSSTPRSKDGEMEGRGDPAPPAAASGAGEKGTA